MDYRGIDDIRQCLTAVQQRRWRLRLLAGLAAIVTVLSAVLVVVTLAAGYWPGQPPAALRWGLLAVTAGVLFIAIARFVFRPFAWRQTPAQVARFVEQARPELRNDLISAVLLADDDHQPSPELVQHAINEAAQRTRRLEWDRTVSKRPIRRWGLVAAIAAVTVVSLAAFQGGPMRRALAAITTPTRYLPHDNAISLQHLSPGDATQLA